MHILWHVIRGCYYNHTLADVWPTGAWIKCLYCTRIHVYIILHLISLKPTLSYHSDALVWSYSPSLISCNISFFYPWNFPILSLNSFSKSLLILYHLKSWIQSLLLYPGKLSLSIPWKRKTPNQHPTANQCTNQMQICD